MILNGFNSDDYIYLKLNNDYEHYKKGEIIRYKIEELRRRAFSDHISVYGSFFELVPKKETSRYDIMPHQLYECAIVKEKALLYQLYINEGNLLIIDNLMKKMLFTDQPVGLFKDSTNREDNLDSLSKLEKDEIIFDKDARNGIKELSLDENNPLTALGQNSLEKAIEEYGIDQIIYMRNSLKLNLDLKEGDILDFKDPAIALLFLDQYYLRLFFNVHILDEKEKLDQFKNDFSNCICDEGEDIRYFKLNDDIKIKGIHDFKNSDLFPKDFDHQLFFDCRVRYFGWNELDDFDYDEDGYIRFVWIRDYKKAEQEVLKIAQRATIEETKTHYRQLKDGEELKKRAIDYYYQHKKRYKEMKKKKPNLTYIEFMNLNEEKISIQKAYMHQRLISTLRNRRDNLNLEQEEINQNMNPKQIEHSTYSKEKQLKLTRRKNTNNF